MSTIRIPPVLRPSVGGAKSVAAQGATLGAALDAFFARYPAVREQIIAPDGSISNFVNVFVDDQDVRYLQGLATPLAPDATITLLPAMAGGQIRPETAGG